MKTRKILYTTGAIVLALTLFLGLVYWDAAAQIRFKNRANEEYLGKILELETEDEEPTLPAWFRVDRVEAYSGMEEMMMRRINLYGTLIVEIPENASFGGYVPGSNVINWQFQDGTGGASILPKLRVKEDCDYWNGHNVYLRLIRVEASR